MVHKHKLDHLAGEQVDCRFRGGDAMRCPAFRLHQIGNEFRHIRIVFDDQNVNLLI